MAKASLLLLSREEKLFRHGGREALRAIFDLPHGECRAARHFAALVDRLLLYIEQVMLPEAAKALEEAAAEQRLHRFRPYLCRVSITERPSLRRHTVTVTIALFEGCAPLFHRSLTTVWDPHGDFQIKKRKKEPKSG